jgi:hypothetical protein
MEFAKESLEKQVTKMGLKTEKMKDLNEDSSETNKKLEKRTWHIFIKLFYTIGNMRAHVKRHHDGKGRFHCQMCENTFSSLISLQYHGGEFAC